MRIPSTDRTTIKPQSMPFGTNCECRIETRIDDKGTERQVLVLEVDLSRRIGISDSGKSTLIGTTHGTKLLGQLPGWPEGSDARICISASVFKPVPAVLREDRKRKNKAAERGFF